MLQNAMRIPFSAYGLEAADEHEIRLAGGIDLKTAVDPRSKDMTGDLYG